MVIKYFSQVESTNLKARELAKKGARPWTVIVAEQQTAGYGKEKVPWFSPKGGLYFSIILPKSELEDLQTLTILAAFIIAKTLKDYYPPEVPAKRRRTERGSEFNPHSQSTPPKKDTLFLDPLIKLPNDVLLNQKKVAGVLTENVIGGDVKLSVIGIGLNTNIKKFPKELENIATSLKIELGRTIDNDKILKQIIEGLKKQLKIISE